LIGSRVGSDPVLFNAGFDLGFLLLVRVPLRLVVRIDLGNARLERREFALKRGDFGFQGLDLGQREHRAGADDDHEQAEKRNGSAADVSSSPSAFRSRYILLKMTPPDPAHLA
jgi:hypothetical protein